MVDQLAGDYAAQPVVFLEQDVDHPVGNRIGRWWAAYSGSGPVYLPLVMADSGHQMSNGPVSFYNVYKGMVDAELTRSSQAYIDTSCWRVGNRVRIVGQMTNLSGVTLSSSGNGATLHAIVYEDAHVGVTDRYVCAAPSTAIASGLVNGGTMTFILETTDLTGVNWDKLHTVVLADYRPVGSSGPYDMLQATRASWIIENAIYISTDGFCSGNSPCSKISRMELPLPPLHQQLKSLKKLIMKMLFWILMKQSTLRGDGIRPLQQISDKPPLSAP